jgi:hypothetical protein
MTDKPHVCLLLAPMLDSEVEKFADWACIGCKRTKLFPKYKFICWCDTKQLVCEDCYRAASSFDWKAAMGPQHSVRDKAVPDKERANSFFEALMQVVQQEKKGGYRTGTAFPPGLHEVTLPGLKPHSQGGPRVISNIRLPSPGEQIPSPPHFEWPKEESKKNKNSSSS